MLIIAPNIGIIIHGIKITNIAMFQKSDGEMENRKYVIPPRVLIPWQSYPLSCCSMLFLRARAEAILCLSR
jgi:hypothetical protein